MLEQIQVHLLSIKLNLTFTFDSTYERFVYFSIVELEIFVWFHIAGLLCSLNNWKVFIIFLEYPF